MWSSLLLVSLLAVFGQTKGEQCPDFSCDTDSLNCPYGLREDKHGCFICQCLELECVYLNCAIGKVCRISQISQAENKLATCVDPDLPEPCQQPLDKGTCQASLTKVYYAADTGICVPFVYSGCSGNENRFDSLIECDILCNLAKFGLKPGCNPVTCAMHCVHGFATDENGCNICKCNEEKPPSITCSPVLCDMLCAQGFEVDSSGCRLCKCKGEDMVGKSIFNVEPGCDDDEEVSCYLHCQYGFQQDQYGCIICQCNEPPTCNPVNCFTDCPHGYHKDLQGCSTCRCRVEDDCPQPECGYICDYGYELDQYGCSTCDCRPDPCDMVDCPEDTVCKVEPTSTDWIGKCVVEADEEIAGCSEVMCLMHCEGGFMTDKYGCEVCRCREFSRRECPMVKCQPCGFGHAVDEYGCRTCECLPDPCLKSHVCAELYVCEVLWVMGCPTCPARANCILPEEVRRIVVNLKYMHSSREELDLEAFESVLRQNLLEVLDDNSTQLLGIQLTRTDDASVGAQFQIIGSKNVVEAYGKFQQHISAQTGSTLTADNMDYMPWHESLVASYSSSAESGPFGDPAEVSGEDQTVMYIIIGCAVGAGLVLIVTMVIALTVMKNKKAQQKPRKNIIYRQAATSEKPQIRLNSIA